MDDLEGWISPAPTITMSDDYLVWAGAHMRSGVPTSELHVVVLPTLTEMRLEAMPASGGTYWFPDLDGNSLVYGVIGGGETPDNAVYLIDLGTDGHPRRLDASGHASMPLVSGETIVWKETDENPLNWGTLVECSILDGTTANIEFGTEESVNYPSMGDGYVVAWQWDPTKLQAYDVRSNSVLMVEAFPEAGTESDHRPHVNGRLLAWSHSPIDGSELELRWTFLP
jgi:hypothetical protein